jgi:iron complex transport system substrate-binding protein
MQKFVFFILFSLLLISCQQSNSTQKEVVKNTTNTLIKHAQGFTLEQYDGYSVLEILSPWPDSQKPFRYALIKDKQPADSLQFDAKVTVPIQSIVVTSTTHIPSLEMLGVQDKLVGFPFADYISSPKTRALIDANKVTELGGSQEINTEVLIALSPELVVGYGVDGTNKNLNIVENAGIPIVYNGDWMEQTPLGKAEWLLFFGALFDKQEEASLLFNKIEADYNEVKEIAKKANSKPTVISGAMYKDIWYLPKGSSWAAAFIADANGDYLYKDSQGTGSLSLSLESVLVKGQQAQFWIGPGQFSSLSQIKESNAAYASIYAFKQQNVFSFTTNVGPTGGVIYYELAPNRPDLVLKDIVKILHPELLPEYNLYFFSPLSE